MDNDIARETVKIMLSSIKEALLGIALIALALVIVVSVVFSIVISAMHFNDIPVNPDIPGYVIFLVYAITGSTILGVIGYWIDYAYDQAREKVIRQRLSEED